MVGQPGDCGLISIILKNHQLVLIALLIIQVLNACTNNTPELKPNIILVYADDLGRGLLGAYGQQFITTPNIDKLASEGIRFDNVYGCMLCAPARASLLTGMHDCHRDEWNVTTGGIYKKLDREMKFEEIIHQIHAVAKPAKEDEIFLGQVAQNAGYITAEFGKLEWGFATTPDRLTRHGWDYHFGYYDHVRCHGFYPPFLFENGQKVDLPGNTHIDCAKTPESGTPENDALRMDKNGKAIYSENIIMEKLLAFMDNNHPGKTGHPFLIYFPTQLPHGPTSIPEVHEDFIGLDTLTQIEKEYASMVKMLDDDVGRIKSKLEEMEILDNTVIIFTADNGHEIYYSYEGRTVKNDRRIDGTKYDNVTTKFYSELSGDIFDGNDGMAGMKRSNWEGGTRVPLLWYWKGKINSGQVSKQMVSNYDLLNTIAEITGQPQIESKDGISYAKTLFGSKSKERDYTVFSSFMGPAIVTKDGWKLRYFKPKDIYQLYFLPEDYREEFELSDQHPARVQELAKILLEECDGNLENGFFGWNKTKSFN